MALAVVTATSTGIGLATAATLAQAGQTVYATMRNPKTGGEQVRAIAEHDSVTGMSEGHLGRPLELRLR